MDIVERLRTNWDFDNDDKLIAADEIERLQLREETLSGIIDGMTARFIEAQGAVEEIERLREKIKWMEYYLPENIDFVRCGNGKDHFSFEIVYKALGEKE